MKRAIYLAKRDAALRTPACLLFCISDIKVRVNLIKVSNTVFGFPLFRHSLCLTYELQHLT